MEAPEQLQVVLGFEKAKAASVGENFLVEDLLDFSNDDGCEADEDGALTESVIQTSAESASGAATPARYCSSTSPVSGPEPHFLGEELCAPFDSDQEWLSAFFEESFADSSQMLHPVPTVTNAATDTATAATVAATTPVAIPHSAVSYQAVPPSSPLFRAEGPIRCARSKRSRAAPRDWSTCLLVLNPTNPMPMEGSLLLPPPIDPTPLPPKKPAKAPKKQHNPLEPSLAPNPDGRKCLHCSTDKTPQWRTGPKGPKTLCNACGVRYKSGRLMPEYRPAASPTFTLSQHSNSHRKVLELRRQKELLHQPSLPPPLPQHYGSSVAAMAGMFAGHYHPGGGGYFDGSDEFLIHNPIGPDFRQLI